TDDVGNDAGHVGGPGIVEAEPALRVPEEHALAGPGRAGVGGELQLCPALRDVVLSVMNEDGDVMLAALAPELDDLSLVHLSRQHAGAVMVACRRPRGCGRRHGKHGHRAARKQPEDVSDPRQAPCTPAGRLSAKYGGATPLEALEGVPAGVLGGRTEHLSG